jgi:hypothetical protein
MSVVAEWFGGIASSITGKSDASAPAISEGQRDSVQETLPNPLKELPAATTRDASPPPSLARQQSALTRERSEHEQRAYEIKVWSASVWCVCLCV